MYIYVYIYTFVYCCFVLFCFTIVGTLSASCPQGAPTEKDPR